MEINIIIEIPVEFATKFYKMLKFVTFGQRSLKEIFAPFVYIIELWWWLCCANEVGENDLIWKRWHAP